MKVLYTAEATASEEGRDGQVRTSDGQAFELALPVELGGDGGSGTNPEQLFAAGYAACFANAMRSVARREERPDDVAGATVTARVGIGVIGRGRLGLTVTLQCTVPALAQDEAEVLVDRAHERCPYSNATRGNVDVELEVRGG